MYLVTASTAEYFLSNAQHVKQIYTLGNVRKPSASSTKATQLQNLSLLQ